MTERQKAQEQLLSRACGLLASRLHIENSEPGPNDDAEISMRVEMLEEAVIQYSHFLMV